MGNATTNTDDALLMDNVSSLGTEILVENCGF